MNNFFHAHKCIFALFEKYFWSFNQAETPSPFLYWQSKSPAMNFN